MHIKGDALLPWTEKYRPKVPNDIIGNQSLACVLILPSSFISTCIFSVYVVEIVILVFGQYVQVKQLHDWLTHWDEQFLNTGGKGKGKKQNDSAKKAVLLSGTPGIGKTTTAKLVSQMLGFQPVEVGVVK